MNATSHGQQLTLFESLVASGAAVVGATVITHPIDVVKVRLQLSAKGTARADSFSVGRFLRFWPAVYRQDGASAFYAGVRTGMLRAASYGAARIGFCAPLQRACGSETGGALLSGIFATVLGNPFEVLKVRLQARPEGASEGELNAMRALVRQEGLGVLARGFHWAAARSALLTASQVVPYARAKAALKPHVGRDGVLLHLISSLIAGLATTTITAPVDVMKTRVMNAAGPEKAIGLSSMLRQEGFFFFFKGWLANYVRIGPQTLFIFLFYEQSQQLVLNLRH